MTDFGAGFKKARQSKGISLEQIAQETKISTRFLQAIENEEFEQLPGGIFNRGFVRTFAERVGLDPDQAVADYQRLVHSREPNEPERDATPSPEKIDRLLYPIAIGALVLLIVIFYLVSRNSETAAESANETPAVVSQPNPVTVAPEPVITPAPQPSEQPSRPPQIVPSAGPPEPVVPPRANPFVVEFEALERTWIRVAADGNSGGEGITLEPGVTRRFTVQNTVTLSIGNAAGVILKLNGEEVQRLGGPGRVRQFTVTPENLKRVISGNMR